VVDLKGICFELRFYLDPNLDSTLWTTGWGVQALDFKSVLIDGANTNSLSCELLRCFDQITVRDCLCCRRRRLCRRTTVGGKLNQRYDARFHRRPSVAGFPEHTLRRECKKSGERFLDCASRLLRGSEGGRKSVGLLRSE
jgi:hypothetical protein